MRSKVYSFILIFCALLLTNEVAIAHGKHKTDYSGYEIFLGIPSGDITKDVTFTCWTHLESNKWRSPAKSNGGLCGATVNYQGQTGIGNSVKIVGGKWFWRQLNGKTHSGRVLNGGVVWPDALNIDVGCGEGVAVFTANISLGGNPADAGNIAGCLDDTHGRIPPRLWGDLLIMN